eukprot:CAMPEP_0179711392 /NCGR_PEP_ID=MMETSP0937-20121108/6960_1 /TAXON_ID=548131 ORGANISM="Ostreococcus mediterraneus, Strain clade-D-RCC2593" /NCGR_SAMPLE_ID=MMETSP0937 /ASSEMBLY_ACC=CAM_ASM_000575 /LENGTH=44 /DNA_ID= /DNA_START= /DNA_END= /DNA_ORIENTATION=
MTSTSHVPRLKSTVRTLPSTLAQLNRAPPPSSTAIDVTADCMRA